MSETYLKDDCILLKKKSTIKRKVISTEKIYFKEIVEFSLNRSSESSISSSIDIFYTKNSYSKRFISLSTADFFAVRWFYDALCEKYDAYKSQEYQDSESEELENMKKAKEMDDFLNKMSKPLSKEQEHKIKISQKYDRCSSGEY